MCLLENDDKRHLPMPVKNAIIISIPCLEQAGYRKGCVKIIQGGCHVVQPDDDLVIKITVAWNDQQGRDVGHSHRLQKRKIHFDPDKLSP